MSDMILVASAAVALAVALSAPFGKAAIDDIRKRIGTLRRIEMKLDLLMKHANIEFEPYKGLPPEVVDALQRGEKIEAIKAYRKLRTRNLKEAKKFIEDVQRRAGG
jgi:ribosomal protein L7/L12